MADETEARPARLTPRQRGFSAKNLQLSEYDPERHGFVDQWLASIKHMVKADERLVGDSWPQDALYFVVSSKLRGSAASWFESECLQQDTEADQTFDALDKKLRRRYGARMRPTQATYKVMQRKKQPQETFLEFAHALRKLAQGVAVTEDYFVEAFASGLRYGPQAAVREHEPETLMEAVDVVIRTYGENDMRPRSIKGQVMYVAADNVDQDDENHGGGGNGLLSPWPKPQGSQSTKRPHDDADDNQKPSKQPYRNRACFECGEEGHFKRDCPVWKKKQAKKPNRDGKPKSSGN